MLCQTALLGVFWDAEFKFPVRLALKCKTVAQNWKIQDGRRQGAKMFFTYISLWL